LTRHGARELHHGENEAMIDPDTLAIGAVMTAIMILIGVIWRWAIKGAKEPQ
jgi:hypothetical protein